MINPEVLLADLKRLLGQLEGDLRERADEVPALGESLRSAYDRAKQAERTAQPFETWREEYLTQVAAAWVLACVFVRFIEDNGLIDGPLLAGSGPRLDQAKDQRTLYFQQHATDSDREYLYYVFRKIEAVPAAAPLFDERHNPLWTFGVSGDGATLLIEFWQRIDPATGALAHDFADPALNTRFLGDLYQDLSEAARKKYALLQTPEFVEEFILDRTLTPAIGEFGLADVRLIDPACGSGHFLLGTFHRLLREWQKLQPAVNVRELAQRALDAVHGVDLNPYAVAIARFRLLVAALKASDIHKLKDAPAFRMNLATGDSLLHGPRPGGERQMYLQAEIDPLRHVYDTEDAAELRRVLGARYHVVVGNPPYITVKDKALSDAYRNRFGSCHMKYSLAVPFMERFFDLAVTPSEGQAGAAGYVGMITANSFMKREFGKRLIEEYIPRWDLTHIIDTSGAYIPGHGTPTVILFGRHRTPVQAIIRAVFGIRGEPQTPADPSLGLVWSAIVHQVDTPGSQSAFVSVTDVARESFYSHPWSIGGGGAAELKAQLDDVADRTLGALVDSIGPASFAGIDDAFVASHATLVRQRVPASMVKAFVDGESLRDWSVDSDLSAFVPYKSDFSLEPLDPTQTWARRLWPFRTLLGSVTSFGGKTRMQLGESWWSWYRWIPERYRNHQSIAFAFVATHNHFVLDRGGSVFNRHAPLIKLPSEATEDHRLGLVGLLNSSIACFWMKQVMSCKGLGGQGGGIKPEDWHRAYEFDVTKLREFPVVDGTLRLSRLAGLMDEVAGVVRDSSPRAVLSRGQNFRRALPESRISWVKARAWMVALQEEMDWEVYSLYGLCQPMPDDRVFTECRLAPRDRPAERLREESGEATIFYDVHGNRGFEDVATSDDLRAIVEKRLAAIKQSPALQLVETFNSKRRWQVAAWEEQQKHALHDWLLSRLEVPELWSRIELISVGRLADRMRRDGEFMEVAELYRSRADFDVTALVAELVESESVPFLPMLRYRPTGLVKRAAWEQVWDLQRRWDEEGEVGEISAPPKYTSADFLKPAFWRLRGKLDLPGERFIIHPYAERESDQTSVIAWAGWDHLQQAKALAAYYVRMKDQEGWAPARLQPLLAGLLELIPWLRQWHNDLDPTYGLGMGDYFSGFVEEEARALGFTLDDVRAWQPPARNSRRRRRASA